MKISIITCCKNSLPFLKETINSVKKQNYKNFEHIFIVSKSNDNTSEYLKNLKYSKKKLFFFDKGNLYNCLNFGIKQAKGQIIYILHSDDVLKKKFVFSKVVKSMKNIDFLFFNICISERNNTKKIIRKWNSSQIKNDHWLSVNLPAHTSLFIKKKIINKIGIYNQKYSISADFDYMIRLFKIKNIKYRFLNNTFLIMRTGGISSNFKYLPLRIKEDLNILKSHYKNNYLTLYFLKIFKKILQLF